MAMFATVFMLLNPSKAFANPSKFSPPVVTATATTTRTFMTFGVGTTTLTLDTYYPTTLADNTKVDSALVLFQVNASSTISSPKINVAVEYSYDNIDWYPQTAALNSLASTTIQTGNYADYQFNIATSTTNRLGGTASTTANATDYQLFSLAIPTPTRYVRVVFYSPSGGGKIDFWGSMQPVKENK